MQAGGVFVRSITNRLSAQILPVFLTATMAASGCMRTDAIKASELPKLNGHLVQSLGQVGNTRVIGVSVSTVETVDGRTVQIKGEYNASVVAQGGGATRFEHPVIAQLVDTEKLSVKGSNRGEAVFDLSKVKHVDIETVDSLKSTLAVTGVSLALAVAVILVVRAATPELDTSYQPK